MSMENINIRFGRRIKELRLMQNVSQEELGFEVGLDKSTIGKYELAKRCINLKTANKLAEALGVSLIDLLK